MKKILILIVLCLSVCSLASANMLNVKVAGEEEINMMKRDLLEKRIVIGKTRLKDFKEMYGEPANIN